MKFSFFNKGGKKAARTSAAAPKDKSAGKQKKNGPAPKKILRPYFRNGRDISDGSGAWYTRIGLDTDFLAGGLTQLVTALLAVGCVLYFGHYVYSVLSSGVSTARISAITQTEVCTGKAFLIRDETQLTAKGSGILVYSSADGARVAKGEQVAGFYATDVSEIRKEIAEKEREADLLARSIAATGVLDSLKAASEGYDVLMRCAAASDWSAFCGQSDSFREALNRSAYFAGEAKDLSSREKDLQKQKETLQKSIGSPLSAVSAPTAGYYFHDSDGYGPLVSTMLANGFTEESYRSLLAITPDTGAASAGTVVANQKWYLAVECPGFALADSLPGEAYSVRFPASDNREITMTLKTVIRTENGCILLLFSDILPAGFNWLRRQTVEIVCGEITGYRIPLSALHVREGITGVYTLHGKNMYFRKINVLYEDVGFCIAAARETEPPARKIWRMISYPSVCAAENTAAYTELARSRDVYPVRDCFDGSLGEGTQTVNHVLFLRSDNRGIPLRYGDSLADYSYLDGLESVIIAGRDLYHGKVVG